MKLKETIILLILITMLVSCQTEAPLGVIGRDINGSDTVEHTIKSFQLVDQDSNIVTNETFRGKIYVADFFFTSCRSICPIMKTQMSRVYKAIENIPDVALLSHTIDPEYDTVALLHDYAGRLGAKTSKWHFVTGVQDSIYEIARKSYYAPAIEDEQEPDGFIHSGAFYLVDKQRRIRGKYDGTKEDEVDRLIADIDKLRKEPDQL
jgi:protein SCO1/2